MTLCEGDVCDVFNGKAMIWFDWNGGGRMNMVEAGDLKTGERVVIKIAAMQFPGKNDPPMVMGVCPDGVMMVEDERMW